MHFVGLYTYSIGSIFKVKISTTKCMTSNGILPVRTKRSIDVNDDNDDDDDDNTHNNNANASFLLSRK